MPIYSLIALILSLFGASYTGIAALKNHYQLSVSKIVEGVEGKLKIIKELDEESYKTGQAYAKTIRRANGAWVHSSTISISFFIIIVFIIGTACLLCWDSLLCSQMPLPTSSYWMGKLVLAVTLLVNLICTLLAFFSRIRISETGEHLATLHRAAEAAAVKRVTS